jgi:broad-specificity NMP kinase
MDKSPPGWETVGTYPEGFLEPDMVILLTVDETNRSLRIGGRGLAMTSEEKRLENQDGKRSSVLELYRMFDPIEIDTSDRSPDEVLEEILHWLNEASLLDWLASL